LHVRFPWQVTHDVSDICKADFLSSVGKSTPVAARFSTVVHPAGSPENLRDVRGFSVKMYTQQGNWDFVGNNIPVSSLSLQPAGTARWRPAC
jgi:catalase